MKSRKEFWVTGLLIVGAFLILSLERWALGELSESPLVGAPFTVGEDGLRFKNFSPSFSHLDHGKVTSRFENGLTAVYTVDPALQATMLDYFKKYRVPYGVFVAMDPNSGKVLALVEYSAENSKADHLALRATYPAASIFKLITASAAIEEKKAGPETVITYHGGLYQLGPRNWVDNPKRDKQKITMAEALAKSANVAFAKVGLRFLDAPTLIAYAERYQFNRNIPFELPVQVSRIEMEAGERGMARTAAGFGDVGLSPLHAAMIASAIANGGSMMSPCIVDSILGPDGKKLYECAPKVFAEVISEETAEALRKMMAMTVISGTSRKAFRMKRRETSLRGITIGGKTGSLTGDDPQGKYSWFVGMAPLEAPEIAIAALVINHPQWKIKASQVAKEGFAAYFQPVALRKLASK